MVFQKLSVYPLILLFHYRRYQAFHDPGFQQRLTEDEGMMNWRNLLDCHGSAQFFGSSASLLEFAISKSCMTL